MKRRYFWVSALIFCLSAVAFVFSFSLFDCNDGLIYKDNVYIKDLGNLNISIRNCGATTRPSTHVFFRKRRFLSYIDREIFVAEGKHKINTLWNNNVLFLEYDINPELIFKTVHQVAGVIIKGRIIIK